MPHSLSLRFVERFGVACVGVAHHAEAGVVGERKLQALVGFGAAVGHDGDAGAMAHPNIMTENMRDGSDAIADWPLLDAMAMCASQADLVAIHSGGGGYAGYMTSAGVTIVADGSTEADERLALALTNDTSLGVMRYADAGYPEALDEAQRKGVRHFRLGEG